MGEMLLDLLARQNEIQKELDKVTVAIYDAKLLGVKDKYGVEIGCIVKDRKGKECRVTGIDASWVGRPWVTGNPRLKDGTFGKARRHLFTDWEVIPKEVDHEVD